MNIKFDKILKSADETYNFGLEYSKCLKGGDVLGLIGNLAAGKTTFVKGLLKGLHYDFDVNSPTFTLINEYEADSKVYHIDFYREENELRWENIGIKEMINSNAITIIEWADLLPQLLPQNCKFIYFEHYEEQFRRVYIK
jgi:tRNA threonylcarbamoyladenosine biosynthesis protein TsaE